MKQDTIRFEQEIMEWGDEEQRLICAKIIINDTPLIKIAYDYELPYAKTYDQENIAGSYIYHYTERIYKLLSSEIKSTEYENKVPVLICECGFEGCWDLIMAVEESEMNIIWKNFHNPHRSKPTSKGGFWDYKNFPVFCFNKKQYYNEINKLIKML